MGWPRGRSRVDFPEWVFFWLGAIPDDELAEMIGVNSRTVKLRRNRLGIPRVPCGMRCDRLLQLGQRERSDAMVLDLLPKLQSLDLVAREMGVSRQRVAQIANRAGCYRIWTS